MLGPVAEAVFACTERGALQRQLWHLLRPLVHETEWSTDKQVQQPKARKCREVMVESDPFAAVLHRQSSVVGVRHAVTCQVVAGNQATKDPTVTGARP